MCRKVTHKTMGDAIIAIKAQPDKCLAPYKCPKCGLFHLTQNRRGDRYFQKFIDRILEKDKSRNART